MGMPGPRNLFDGQGTPASATRMHALTSGTLGTCCYWIASYAVIHLIVFVRKMIGKKRPAPCQAALDAADSWRAACMKVYRSGKGHGKFGKNKDNKYRSPIPRRGSAQHKAVMRIHRK